MERRLEQEESRLTAESGGWLRQLGAAGAVRAQELVWRVASQGEGPDRLLPWWLEPELDYGTGTIVVARDPVGRLPSRGVRAHETAHWALAALGATTTRCLGLEGLCDAAAALLIRDPVIVMPVPTLARDLRRPALDITADLSSRAHLGRLLAALENAGSVEEGVLARVRRALAGAAADDIHRHAFGIPYGAWLWQALRPLPRTDSLGSLVRAAAVPQQTPEGAVRALLDALPSDARSSAAVAAHGLGLPVNQAMT